MQVQSRLSRRDLLIRSGSAWIGAGAFLGSEFPSQRLAADEGPDASSFVSAISDPVIRFGVESAIDKNLLPAATEANYPGYFAITADARAFGDRNTWPGLDSWQMAGAYLLLGRTRLVLDYFEFVRASQRADGNVPFAVFPGDTPAQTYLRGLKSPDDVFIYEPPRRDGAPASSQIAHSWIGLFEHWQPIANPLSTLAPVCYILTAAEIFDATRSAPWLNERLASIEAAANYLWSRRDDNGLIGGSGFYIELPPRYGWDGVTQCYCVQALRELTRLLNAAGDAPRAADWSAKSDELAESFRAAFWCDDHFAEYIHAERGLVDSHGLSDVNWAAVAFGIADGRPLELVWERLLAEEGFWLGDMPTQLVSRPFTYEPWEHHEPLPWTVSPLHDVAAMGRAWYLEITACRRMGAFERLAESVRKVCLAGRPDGFWRERYHPQPDGTVAPAGAEKYCEYPAVLVRAALGNQETFR